MYEMSYAYELCAEARRGERSWCLPLSNLECICVLVVLFLQLFNMFESFIYMYTHTYIYIFHYIHI